MNSLFELATEKSEQVVLVVNKADNTILYCNPFSIRFFEANNQSDLIGLNITRILHRPLGELELQQFNRQLKLTANWQDERKVVTRKGKTIWAKLFVTELTYEGKELFLIRIDDISEIKQTHAELKNVTELFEIINSATSDGIWDWSLDTEVMYFSQRWKAMLGYEEPELDNSLEQFQRLLHPEDVTRVTHYLRTCIVNHEHPYRIEFRMRHKKGHYIWILSRGTVVINEKGIPIRFTGTHVDISQQKKAEEELMKAKEMAEYASKAKADFLSTMSHEMRTPLNAVIGFTNLLLRQEPKPEQIDYLKTLGSSAENLLALINDVLDFSRVESGKIELEELDYSFNDWMNNFRNSFLPKAAEKGLSLDFNLDATLPKRIIADPVRLGQIINNLLNNAIKFTNEGGVKLTVLNGGKVDGKLELQFMVEDTGIGIEEKNLDKIFDSFTQANNHTTRHFGGSGLGLAIAKKLLSLYNGEMKVESKPGQGSKFYFNVLVTEGKTFSASQQDSSPKPFAHLGNAKILIVEDNAVNRAVVTKFLNLFGLMVEEAHNGKQALERLKSEEFDAILMDLQMPEMDGYETAANIRKMQGEVSKIPIIALTASATVETRNAVLASGMNSYIAKPFQPDDLHSKIQEALSIKV